MSELATKIEGIIDRLNEVTALVTRHVENAFGTGSRGQIKRKRTRRKTESPPWLGAITSMLALLSADVQHIKEECQRSSRVAECRITEAGDQEAEDSRRQTSEQETSESDLRIVPNQSPCGGVHLPEKAPAPSQSRLGESHFSDAEAIALSSGDGGYHSQIPYPRVMAIESQMFLCRLSSSPDSEEGGETTANTATEPTLPTTPALPRARADFSLSVEEMGEKLVSNVMNFTTDPAFAQKISIKGLGAIDWPNLAKLICPPPEDYDLLGVIYSKTEGIGGNVELRACRSRFELPDFSQTIEEPPLAKCLKYLDEMITDPPTHPVPYYVGPPLHDGPLASSLNSMLHPGQRLLQLDSLDGINRAYWHVGRRGSGTATHCEDMELYSLNVVFVGWKLWIIIRRQHTVKFETFVRKHWPTNSCDQFVRHSSLLFSPVLLEKEGIEFDVILAGPGEMIVTFPRQYHMVVNVTDNFAVAINFLPEGKPIVPMDTCVCPQCGLYPLEWDGLRKVPYAPINTVGPDAISRVKRLAITTNLKAADGNAQRKRSDLKKRQSNADTLPLPKRAKNRLTKRYTGASQCDLERVKTSMRSIDKLCKFPLVKQPPTSRVYMAVAAIWSRPAIEQFCSLVRSTRDLRTNSVRTDVSEDEPTRIAQRVRSIAVSEHRSCLERFLVRLNQVYLAEEIDNSKDGRLRADPELIKEIRQRTGMKAAQLDWHRKMGNKWKRICAGNDGLLCFIFLDAQNPFNIPPETFTGMTDEELNIFRHLLSTDYTTSICLAGRAFQDSLQSTTPDVDFLWEAREFPVDKLPEKVLLENLKLVPSALGDLYVQGKYPDWPKPDEWPSEWEWASPVDPISLLDPNGRQCDMCVEATCHCIDLAPRTMPRIKHYGLKGRGLQAVADRPGQIAYQKGEIIGQLLGELAPLDTHNDGWALELTRSDHPGKPSVCQIYCKVKGNYFRLLNHDCDSNATFTGRVISGQFRSIVTAKREIRDGDEITVGYGREYGRGRKCLCDTCRLWESGKEKLRSDNIGSD